MRCGKAWEAGNRGHSEVGRAYSHRGILTRSSGRRNAIARPIAALILLRSPKNGISGNCAWPRPPAGRSAPERQPHGVRRLAAGRHHHIHLTPPPQSRRDGNVHLVETRKPALRAGVCHWNGHAAYRAGHRRCGGAAQARGVQAHVHRRLTVDGDGHRGPGNLTVEVTYLLNNSNELTILYSAVTDKTTVVNLTSHIYFNLNGCKKEIYDQVLTINSQKATEINSVLIPTGKIENILGSALDYHKPVRIGDKITKIESGYDHNYILSKQNPGELTFAASVHDAGSGRIMEMFTTEPAVQLYSANHFDGTLTGKYGIAYKKHFALCLEAQHYPDSPNHPEFPSTILKPGETYSQKTIYKFGIE